MPAASTKNPNVQQYRLSDANVNVLEYEYGYGMRMKIACMFGSHNLFIDNGLKASISGMCVCMCVRARECLCSFVRKHRVSHINNIGTVFA